MERNQSRRRALAAASCELRTGEVSLSQRYYDPFGLTERTGDRVEAGRRPERQWVESKAAFRGELRAVTACGPSSC